MEHFKRTLIGYANRTGWPIGTMATLIVAVLLMITQMTGAVLAFLSLLVVYGLLWFIFGKTFFKQPPI